MAANYVLNASSNFDIGLDEPIMPNLLQQYERVVVESLITTFGLDFILNDRHGGDVDTIHNVRQIGTDTEMVYKNMQNQYDFDVHEPYSKEIKSQYDSDPRYKDINADISRRKKEGTLIDAYTGLPLARNADVETDHVISTQEIHEDRGRILAGLDGRKLANTPENLQPTDHSINESMKNKPISDYAEWIRQKAPERTKRLEILNSKPISELTDKERKELHKLEQQESIDIEMMMNVDKQARKSYEAKLKSAYYTSPKFAKDVALSAGNVGIRMGIRQAVGLVFTEVWFAVKEKFQQINDRFDLGNFFCSIGEGIKQGFENAKSKYKEIFSRFLDGAVAGALSSLFTTICNIFFTTAKNVIRIIRQVWASLVSAAKVLFINPDNYTFGERIRAVVKILATGASMIAGVIVEEAIRKSPVATIPVVGDLIPIFCGTLLSGIMSCTFLYFIDRSEIVNNLIKALDSFPCIEKTVNYFREQADYFERYAAELMRIDIESFKHEISIYKDIVLDIEQAATEKELNIVLKKAYKILNIKLPWNGYESFNSFMNDPNARLVFE